jgi:hypothetical protein
MPQSHDQNFKNLFLDFLPAALAWVFPQAIEAWGAVVHVESVCQETKKRRLADAHFALDIPLLFTFAGHQLLLWLVEFQEDKAKFSIYHVARYIIDLMEAYPQTVVVPTVLFTDRKKWHKDVQRRIEAAF